MNELRVRLARIQDFSFLAAMLGEAAVWRPDKPTPTGEQVMADPRYALYLNVGRRLITELIEASVAQGCRALSLSVAENNPARRLYESVGFALVEKHGHSCTMVRHAAAVASDG